MAEETSEQILARLKARLEKVNKEIVTATLTREAGKVSEEAYEQRVQPLNSEEQALTSEIEHIAVPLAEEQLPLSFLPIKEESAEEYLPIGLMPITKLAGEQKETLPMGFLPMEERPAEEQLPMSFMVMRPKGELDEELPLSLSVLPREAPQEELPLSLMPLAKEKPSAPTPELIMPGSLINFKVVLELTMEEDFGVQRIEYAPGFDSQFASLQQQVNKEVKKMKAWAVGHVEGEVLHIEKMVTSKEEVDMAAREGLEEAIEWTLEPHEPVGYFHATMPKNIPSIMEHGLLPGDFIIGTDQDGLTIILDRGSFFGTHPGVAAMYAACRYQRGVPPYEPFFKRGWMPLSHGELWAILEIRSYPELDRLIVASADQWSSGGYIMQFAVPSSRISHIYLSKLYYNEYFMAVPELEKYKDMIVWCERGGNPTYRPKEADLYRAVADVHGMTLKHLDKYIDERLASMETRRKPVSGLPPFTVVMPENGYSCMIGDFTGTYVDVLNHMEATGHRSQAKGFAKYPTAFGKMVFEKTSDAPCTAPAHQTVGTESGLLLCINCNRVFLAPVQETQASLESRGRASGTAEA